jgi:replication initiation and membrane attachment protein DnaB
VIARGIMDIPDLSKLKKAISIFEDFRQEMKTDRDKAGAIQAFEFCYELSWKSMKRALKNSGIDARVS